MTFFYLHVFMTCFFATLKPGFHWRRKHERKHNNSYFTMKTALDTGESANTMIKIFLFSCTCAYACICGATIENETPLRHNTSTRIFTTRGYVWPMRTLDPDYLAPKQFSKMAEGSDDFAVDCVFVEFRFHLSHPHYAGGIRQRSFTPTVRPSVQTSLLRK